MIVCKNNGMKQLKFLNAISAAIFIGPESEKCALAIDAQEDSSLLPSPSMTTITDINT